MRKFIIGLVVGLVVCCYVVAAEHPEHPKAKAPEAPAAVAKGSGILDGKMFTGEIGHKGAEKGDKDALIFKDGTFLSTACVAYGFKETPYTATEKDGVCTFKAEGMNAMGETMSWTGTIKNDEVEATAIYRTKGGWFKKSRQIDYSYKGKATTAAAMAAEDATKAGKSEPAKKHEHPEHPK